MKIYDLNAFLDQFDLPILRWINADVGQNPTFDHLVSLLTTIPLLKSVPLVALLYWLWHERRDIESRGRILATGIGTCLAFLLGRLLATGLPFRYRPLHRPDLDWNLPVGMDPQANHLWSAFPSDHGALIGAMAAGIFLLDRRLGLFAALWGAGMCLMPRLYVGLHHPADLLAGVLVGLLTVALLTRPVFAVPLGHAVGRWSARHAPSFAAAMFCASYVLATNGNDLRQILMWLKNVLI